MEKQNIQLKTTTRYFKCKCYRNSESDSALYRIELEQIIKGGECIYFGLLTIWITESIYAYVAKISILIRK